MFPCLTFTYSEKSMGVKHTVLPDGQPPNCSIHCACTAVWAKSCRSRDGCSPKMAREGTFIVTFYCHCRGWSTRTRNGCLEISRKSSLTVNAKITKNAIKLTRLKSYLNQFASIESLSCAFPVRLQSQFIKLLIQLPVVQNSNLT